MKKFPPQNRHIAKYALLAISFQCFLVGISRASDISFQPKSIVEINLLPGKIEPRGITQTAPVQSKTVTGKVILSDDNQGAPGVTVYVKGTTIGVTTDATGNYS